jgi:hypothetical protein
MFALFSKVFEHFRLSPIHEVSTDDGDDDDVIGEEWRAPSLPASAAQVSAKKTNVNDKRLVSSPLAKPPAGENATDLATAVTRVFTAFEKQAQITTQCLGSIIYIYIYKYYIIFLHNSVLINLYRCF